MVVGEILLLNTLKYLVHPLVFIIYINIFRSTSAMNKIIENIFLAKNKIKKSEILDEIQVKIRAARCWPK